MLFKFNVFLVTLKIVYTDYKHFVIIFECINSVGGNCTNPDVSKTIITLLDIEWMYAH